MDAYFNEIWGSSVEETEKRIDFEIEKFRNNLDDLVHNAHDETKLDHGPDVDSSGEAHQEDSEEYSLGVMSSQPVMKINLDELVYTFG